MSKTIPISYLTNGCMSGPFALYSARKRPIRSVNLDRSLIRYTMLSHGVCYPQREPQAFNTLVKQVDR